MPDQKYTFDEIEAVARLAHKYQIEDVQEQAVSLLKTYYTDKFREWDPHWSVKSPVAWHCANPVGVVLLARILNEPSMLPTALYSCAILGSKVLDGWKRHDGTIVNPSLEDAKAAVSGYGALSRDHGPMLDRIYAPPISPACTSQFVTDCAEGIEQLRDRFKAVAAMGPPAMLTPWGLVIRARDLVCRACGDELIRREGLERREVWCALPAMFGVAVEGWETCNVP